MASTTNLIAAGEMGAAALLRTERIARRMAGAAMAEPIDEIAPAKPLRRRPRFRPELM